MSITLLEALARLARWKTIADSRIWTHEAVEVIERFNLDNERMARELQASGDVISNVALLLNKTHSGHWSSSAGSSILRGVQLLANREKELERLKRRMKDDELRGGDDAVERWDRTVAAFLEDDEDTTLGHGGGDFFIGVVQRRHRLFLPGDIAILIVVNGQASRQRAWCRSSRGYTIRDCYMQYAKWKDKNDPRGIQIDSIIQTNRSLVRPVEHPDHLVGRRPDDPDVRRFVVETLCAGDSAAG